MRSSFVNFFIALVIACSLASPTLVVFDSDIGPDVDDVGALTVIHYAILNGEASLLAEVCCTSDKYGAPALDVVSTYFSCEKNTAMVGTSKRNDSFLSGPAYQKYNKYLAQNFPNSVKTGDNATDAVIGY